MRFSFLSLFLILAACEDPDRNVLVGRGYKVADLPVATQARIYRAAVQAAFDVDDPSLVLYLHPRMFVRYRDQPEGAPVPDSLAPALRNIGLIRGLCDPQDIPGRRTPRCMGANAPGYLVRFSEVLAAPNDTALVYVEFQLYDIPGTPSTEAIHFKNAYKVVRTGTSWVAAQEARVPR